MIPKSVTSITRSLTVAVLLSTLLLSPQQAQSRSSETPTDVNVAVHRIEANVVNVPMGGNEAPIRLTLKQLMDVYKVPGLSIAAVDNFRILWARSYGVIETGSQKPVTPKTLFQAGSIRKPVAASGALALVEQGKLGLDEDVNLKLRTWRVPENEFTKTEKVTLRRIMSHSAGLTVHGFPGYDVDAPLPTLVQIFDGEKPANTAPIRVDFVPGTMERYSGGGTTIEQQLMIDVTGKLFPALLRELVLDKIGMTDSSYEQPLPPVRAVRTAGGTRAGGSAVHGRWHIYPEMAAAGLWTTPTDLAKFAIEIALSKHGKSNRVLSEKMTQEMLTPVIDEAGLGFFLEKDNPGQFGHNGADEGFQALLTMNAESGRGLAVMANSDNGIAVAALVRARVAKEYGWQTKAQKPNASEILALIAALKGVDTALRRYSELKASGSNDYTIDESTLNGLGYQLLFSGKEQDAISVFARNVQEYPQSSNAHASLGGAYAQVRQKQLAIQSYERALELDPKNRDAADGIKNLK